MGIYNNPALGQAFENIAGLFAPPSGADSAAWATANAKRAEADRLAQFFQLAQDPNSKWEALDRLGIGAGAYTPNQSMRGVEMDDATKRFGINTASGDNRYSVDTTAATSRANNAASVAGDIERQKLNSLAGMFGPLSEGQIRPAVPQSIGSMYGAGAIPQADGTPKPMSSDEVIGAAMQGMGSGAVQGMARDKFAPSETQVMGQEQRALRGSGQITDQMVIDKIMGAPDVTNVVGPDGKPVITTTKDALGQEPFINAGAQAKPTNALAQLQDGSQVPAVQGPDGIWMHAQTGEPLPPNVQIFDIPKPVGTAAELGVGKATNNYVERQIVDTDIARNTAVQLRDMIAKSPASQGAVGWMRGTAQNILQTGTEIGNYFGGEVAKVNEAIQSGAADAGIAGSFDPNIPAIEMMSNLLAFQYAKTTTGERLSNEMLRASKAALGLDSLTANQADALARLDRAIKLIGDQRNILQGVRKNGIDGPPNTPSPAPQPGMVEDGYVFKGGDPADPASWEQQ
jgi:hypothetical protein